jgi:hypothetical protein
LADVNVLNFRRNDSLVFDAAGKCILTLHSPEDLMHSHGQKGHSAVGHGVSLKGKKCSAKPVQKAAMRPGKRRRVISDDEDGDGDGDDDDELLDKRFSKHPAEYDPDQSLEGLCFILPDATQN